MTLVGAGVTAKSGQSKTEAITAFEAATGRTLPIRRCYDSGVPADVNTSQAKYDLGVRASVLSFKPTISTPIATLDGLATSIAAAGHTCDVIIYHEPVDNMSGPDFVALYRRSCAPFRDAGIPVGVCFTNYSCNLPYADSQSALERYWPGDDVVDFLSLDQYGGTITTSVDAAPMEDMVRRAAQFADARGVELGVAEYGVDGGGDVTRSDRWLRSITDWAAARAAQGRPLRWLSYFHSDVGGNYWLTNKAEYVDAYTDSYRVLEG
jgi:hypothetical protein